MKTEIKPLGSNLGIKLTAECHSRLKHQRAVNGKIAARVIEELIMTHLPAAPTTASQSKKYKDMTTEQIYNQLPKNRLSTQKSKRSK